jgi:indolepyruvate ferredoxin oxidoreductase, beta subunit
MPMPGDVDIVLASELMEAARAVERGFVTPDRTLLIASAHRVFAMTEKIALADGRADATALFTGCREAARQLVAFDMAALADATGSALSAVLFGALAGSGALPFPRPAFEAAIRRGKVGVAASLAAFAAGYEAARSDVPLVAASAVAATRREAAPAAIRDLLEAAEGDFRGEAGAVVAAAIERLNDYQDADYAKEFLARLAPMREIERQHRDTDGRLLTETARQLALAMAYEDTIRVADLKIRTSRFARVRREVDAGDDQIVEIAEFFHPRTQELADTLPAPIGRWLLHTGWARRMIDRLTHRGRIVKTTSMTGFLLLYVLAMLKPLRRRSLRYAKEQAALAAWLDLVAETARTDYALACELARARSLVKGYGETHERGRMKFDKIVTQLPRLSSGSDAADKLAGLIKAALADEEGRALDGAIADIPSAAAVVPAPASTGSA